MRILLVGCGNMGQAILTVLMNAATIKSTDIAVVDPIWPGGTIAVYRNLDEIKAGENFTHVVLAVKPQTIIDLLPTLKRFEQAIFVSVIAGKNISFFKNFIPQIKLLRTMPNLPVTVGAGVVAYFCHNLNADEINEIVYLLVPLGSLIELQDETHFDIITAISGSGPAYVYLFAETLRQAAINGGLAANVADELIRQTFIGSMELAKRSDRNFSQLQDSVTSKSGTTEAALKVLNDGRFSKVINEAVKAAQQRSKELSN